MPRGWPRGIPALVSRWCRPPSPRPGGRCCPGCGGAGEGERRGLALALGVDQHDLAGLAARRRGSSRRARPRSRAGWCGAAAGHRARGRSPSWRAGPWPRRVSSMPMSLSLSRLSSLAIIRSTIATISSWVSCGKTIDVVDAVEELGAEVLLELVDDLGLHPVVAGLRCRRPAEKPSADALGDVPGAEVGRHDDDGVLEVDHPALGVGQPAVLEDLQQRVEDVRVGLLDLVEEHHGERLAAHLLGELAALLVADVAGRRAEQPRDGVLLASTRDMSSWIRRPRRRTGTRRASWPARSCRHRWGRRR